MRIPRLYLNATLSQGIQVNLEGERLNYVARVLRLKPGAELRVFNGEGGEFMARLESIGKREAVVQVAGFMNVERESGLALTLAQGISRSERMDLVVQKATELGVTAIVPLVCERCVVRMDERRAHKKLDHWRAIAISACEQSGRNRPPLVHEPVALGDWLRAVDTQARRLLLDPRCDTRLREMKAPLVARLALLIGPEGGLSDSERDTAYTAGFEGVNLGPRVLRTETAALAAISAVQTLWGD